MECGGTNGQQNQQYQQPYPKSRDSKSIRQLLVARARCGQMLLQKRKLI